MEYTKKQLLSALRHWTRRLPTLEESRSKVVDELIEVFGKEDVCNNLKAAFVLSKVFGEDDSNDHTIISGND